MGMVAAGNSFDSSGGRQYPDEEWKVPILFLCWDSCCGRKTVDCFPMGGTQATVLIRYALDKNGEICKVVIWRIWVLMWRYLFGML